MSPLCGESTKHSPWGLWPDCVGRLCNEIAVDEKFMAW
nr:MAG TPA: hypothetical protein [Caudoviricetes sp.]